MIIMDANAALAVAMGFDVGDALTLLRDEDEEIIAPTLLTAEVCHALSKYVPPFPLSIGSSMTARFGSSPFRRPLGSTIRHMTCSICFSRVASVQRCSPLTASSRISAADAASIAYAR